MKRYLFCAVLLAACQPSHTEMEAPPKENVTEITGVEAGVVKLVLNPPVSEPRACIIPITVENGLDDPTNVTMIGFDLTGPGEDAKGNMFAPQAAAGDVSQARVIVEGQSCEAFDTISAPEVRCTSGEENCAAEVKFIDGEVLRFSQTG